MKLILKENNKFVIRFDHDEELIGSIKKFCVQQKIYAGFFWGIGAASQVLLSSYDLDKRAYFDSRIEESLEISSLTGNIAKFKGKTVVHAHGVFSDFDTRAHAGHVKELIVGATCEILLEKFDGKVERQFNKSIALNLLQ